MKTGTFKIELTTRQRELLIAASEAAQVGLLRRANKIAAADAVTANVARLEAALLNQATDVLRNASEMVQS